MARWRAARQPVPLGPMSVRQGRKETAALVASAAAAGSDKSYLADATCAGATEATADGTAAVAFGIVVAAAAVAANPSPSGYHLHYSPPARGTAGTAAAAALALHWRIQVGGDC